MVANNDLKKITSERTAVNTWVLVFAIILGLPLFFRSITVALASTSMGRFGGVFCALLLLVLVGTWRWRSGAGWVLFGASVSTCIAVLAIRDPHALQRFTRGAPLITALALLGIGALYGLAYLLLRVVSRSK